MRPIKEIVYERIALGLPEKNLFRRVLKRAYITLYRDTPFNKRFRIRRWVEKNKAYMKRNGIGEVTFAKEGVVFRSDGIRWAYNPTLAGGGGALWEKQEFDKEIFDFLTGTVKRGKRQVFLDIGANIGSYTLKLKQIFPKSEIHAFEPIPSTYRQLERNIAVNNPEHVFTYNLALSDHNGKLIMRNDLDTGNYIEKTKKKNTSEVRTMKLDDFIKKEGIKRIDVMKCDVEGAELLVLNGAKKSLQKWMPILVLEVCDHHTRRFGYSPEILIAELEKRGYQGYYFRGGKGVKLGPRKGPLTKVLEESPNMIFMPKQGRGHHAKK